MEEDDFDFDFDNDVNYSKFIKEYNHYDPIGDECWEELINEPTYSSNTFYDDSTNTFKKSLSKCFSLQIQCITFIKKNIIFKKNFNILTCDLRYDLNKSVFNSNIRKRKKNIKKKIWPIKKISNKYKKIGNKSNGNIFELIIEDIFSLKNNVNEWRVYNITSNDNINYDLIMESELIESDYFKNIKFFPNIYVFCSFYDFFYKNDTLSKKYWYYSGFDYSNDEKYAICELINNNPYIDGKLKWYNSINKTFNITELFIHNTRYL